MTRREWICGTAAGLGAAAISVRGAEDRAGMTLIASGHVATIVVAAEEQSAARYFAKVVEELTGISLPVTTEEFARSKGPVIRIGSMHDAKIQRLLGTARTSKLSEQGIAVRTVIDEGQAVLVIAGGSRAATPHACGEVLNYLLDAGPNRASIRQIDLVENPALPYRIFWNWDHSTNWVRGVHGEQEEGCVNPYAKKRPAFLNDNRALLDYMGEHKLNGLILWGFLREKHGGVEDSNLLAEYAYDRGVRVLPGIGTSYYGGFYYQGPHEFNMASWTEDKPDDYHLLAKRSWLVTGGTGVQRVPDAICPSHPANQEWLRRGARWMFTEFPKLGGVNLENGDFSACQCERCKAERAKPENDPNFYWDMAATQLPIIEVAHRMRPDAWITYATYTGFNPEELWKETDLSVVRSKVPKFVSKYPEDAICQWTYTGMVKSWGEEPESVVRKRWPSGLRPPTKRSIGLLHQGSQWYNDTKVWWTKSPRGNFTGQRYVDISELIRYTCQRCAEEGLDGLELTGEVSDASPANELNYLAFEEFSWHPNKSMEEFVSARLPVFYGGAQETQRFLRILRSEEQSLPQLLHDMQAADEMSRGSQLNARQRRRWSSLRAEIARRISLLP